MLDRFRSLALTLCMLVLLGGLAFWIFSLTEGGKSFLGDTFGSGNLPVIDFETVELEGQDQAYLVCPESYCLQGNAESPNVWAVPVRDLMSQVVGTMDLRDDIRTERMDIPGKQFDFVITVPGRPWPDLVTIRFISLAERLSTIAIYARTPVGKPTPLDEQKSRLGKLLDKATRGLPSASVDKE